MAKKRRGTVLEPYSHNQSIVLYYEFPFGKDVIKPGDTIRIRNLRGTFKVFKFVHNMEKNVQWVDCMDNKTGEFKSFYVEKIKTVVRPKRSRRKKLAGT